MEHTIIYSSTDALQKMSIQQEIQKNTPTETPTPSSTQEIDPVPGQATLPSPYFTLKYQGTSTIKSGESPVTLRIASTAAWAPAMVVV